MDLTQEQFDKFMEIHLEMDGNENYSEAEVREIATGIANYYLTLYKIYQRLKKEGANFDK